MARSNARTSLTANRCIVDAGIYSAPLALLMRSMTTTTVGQFIFKRIHQLGVKHVFGVPGDFNMPLLDELLDTKKVKWIGNCNELNAAYAADGYSRINQTPSAFVTTYGVGEMSAINGTSGSHCEYVPVVHIVGVPSREQITDAPFLHHAPSPTGLRKGDFLDYAKSSRPFSVASELLHDLSSVQRQVDYAILQTIRHKRPSYIFVPVDMTSFEIPADALDTPLEFKTVPEPTATNQTVEHIVKSFENAKRAVIIGDAMALRYNHGEKLNALLTKTGAYGVTTIMGKGLFDETHPNFAGCYGGDESRPEIKELVESADFVLDVGPYHSDYNTGVFTNNVPSENYIAIAPFYCNVFGKNIHAAVFEEVLDQVYAKFESKPDKSAPPAIPNEPKLPTSGTILPNDFLNLFSLGVKEDDVVIVETGSFQPGSGEVKLQKNGKFISQVGYASIGYTLPAAVGAATALEDKKGRVLLIEGDGSAQMTVQELSTAIRNGLRLTVFLINNDGYLIERALHGPKQPYNDIAAWDWTLVFQALGTSGEHKTHKVHNVEEFTELITNKEFQDAQYPQLVEVFMPKYDAPAALSKLAEINNERNAKLNKAYSEEHDSS